MADPLRPRPVDVALFGESLLGQSTEPNYSGAPSFLRRRWTRTLEGVDVAVFGVPLDVATSNRPGARFGPRAIRAASSILDGDPVYPFGVDIFSELVTVDVGDAVFDYGRLEDLPAAIEQQARALVEAGVHVFALGGDHFLTWPMLRATAAKHGPVALVHFDAHQDTWPDDGRRIDHGTMIARAATDRVIVPERSIQVGIRTHAPQTCGIEIIHGYELPRLTPEELAMRIRGRIGDHKAYLTFDIDCLDPAFAPGTGTPVCGGPSSAYVLATMRALADVHWVGGDVVEVAPAYDHAEITALAAATIGQVYLGLLAERKEKGLPIL